MNNQRSTLRPKLTNLIVFFERANQNFMWFYWRKYMMFKLLWYLSGTCTRITNPTQFAPPYLFFPCPCLHQLCCLILKLNKEREDVS